MNAVLEVADLGVHFGAFRALHGISLTVNHGDRVAIIGPNGAGKTTLFNALDGTLRPSHGRVRLLGRDVTSLSVVKRARLGLARTYQITNLFARLTVLENVSLAVADQGVRRRLSVTRRLVNRPATAREAEDLLRQWGLWQVRNSTVADLAYGQQRTIEIVMGLACSPQILLLDEPMAGLTRRDTVLLAEVVSALPRDVTVVMIEHDLDAAFALADEVKVFADGTLLDSGPPNEIRRSAAVMEAYFGKEAP